MPEIEVVSKDDWLRPEDEHDYFLGGIKNWMKYFKKSKSGD
jgi:hypothetical protein